MNRLNRYILWQCLTTMIFIGMALTIAVWLVQSLRLLDLIVNGGLSALMFLYLAVLMLPQLFDIVMPIGVFVAVLFVFNRLITESELVVMRAAGFGPLSLTRPVLLLGAVTFALLMSFSVYFLPAANREFRNVQFEVRSKFVSGLLREGAFTTIVPGVTIFVGARNYRGELTDLLIQDDREPKQPVTLLAERGGFAEGDASRLVMVNGSRQQYNRDTDKLSVLTFERYALDLNAMRNVSNERVLGAEEQFLGELLSPPAGLDPRIRRIFFIEANQRMSDPLTGFSFAVIPLAWLLPGEFNRRGQLMRVLAAIGSAALFESLYIVVKNLEEQHGFAIPLSYVLALFPLALGLAVLMHRGIRFRFWPSRGDRVPEPQVPTEGWRASMSPASRL
jgi:lipopolysaccharide export system permease protein